MAKAAKTKEEDKEVAKKKFELAMDRLNKQFGAGSVIYGDQKVLDVETISTGSIGLDIAMGVGGMPRGRIVEIIAPESAGKTTLCLHVVANAQKQGILCAYIDMEHHLSGSYAKMLAVDLNKMILSQPTTGESAMEIARQLILSGEVGVIVIDSVASLVPASEVDKDNAIGNSKMAGIGRLMSQGLRVLNPIVESNNVLLMFTNQIRMNPGAMGGSGEEPAGGRALRFYAAIRLDMRRIKNDKDEELSRTKIKVLKNKVGTPFKEIEVDLVWGEGFGKMGEIVDLAEEWGIIKRAGSWYSYGDNKIGQGREAAIQFLIDNEEFMLEIKHLIMQKLSPDTSVVIEEVRKEK